MSVTIRPTIANDSAHLRRWLLEPGILAYFPMCDGHEVDDSIRIWMSFLPQESTLTAEANGKVAGMAVLYLQPFQKLKHQCLFAIVVAPEFRGQGIGTKLLKELEKRAKKKFSISLLHLEVYETNPAYNLYKRLGYREYGQQKRFLKEGSDHYSDKILMQKTL